MTTGIETPIPPENKNAPDNNKPVIEASLKLEVLNHIPKYIKRKIKNAGMERFPITVKPYGERASDGK
jgi:hypothetical protein